MLLCNVSVRNSVGNPDKPTVKCVHKSIFKFFSTSSVLPGKPIHDSNVRSIKLVNASFICSSKPSHGSNVHLSKLITSSIAVQINSLVVVIFVILSLLVLVLFVLVNKLVVVMFV